MTRIVQVANFVAPHSGGIRTVLHRLATGYAAAGYDVVQVVPGPVARCTVEPWGRRIELRGCPLPGTGYRVLTPPQVTRVLGRYVPDRLEIHDRATLRGLGRWARRRGVRSCVVSHERLDRLLAQWAGGRPHLTGTTIRLADRSNARLAEGFDTVVCTTAWAAEEFRRLSRPNRPAGHPHRPAVLRLVPLGVDLDQFHPSAADPALRASVLQSCGAPDGPLLVMVSRLSPEKLPSLAVLTLAELRRRGVPAALAVAGDGPLRGRLVATDLPVHLLGHMARRADVAALLASADIALAPGPVETFGLAAVEALASGTPVVVNAASALGEVLGPAASLGAGRAAAATPAAFADAVTALLATDVRQRRDAARARAENFGWAQTVAGFLDAHDLPRTWSAAA